MSETITRNEDMSIASKYDNIYDEMVYDIARHTASVLSSALLNKINASKSDADREYWEARRRIVKNQVKALDVSDRMGLIAQDQVWKKELLGFEG